MPVEPPLFLGLAELVSILVVLLFWAGVLGGLLYLGKAIKKRFSSSAGE